MASKKASTKASTKARKSKTKAKAKSKPRTRKKTARARTAKPRTTSGGLLASQFLTEIRKEFLGGANPPPWPGPAQPEAKRTLIRELPEVLRVMLEVLEDLAPLPAGAPAGSAVDRFIRAATRAGWPNNGADIPREYRNTTANQNLTAAFRRYELASAINLMVQAYHRSGAGGGASSFPPEKP
jgi:hypothetical protein